MRLLLVSNFGGDGELDVVMRCSAAGHAVKWYFSRTDRTSDYGKGLADIVDDWRDWARWADIIMLADNTKYLREIDAWRKLRGTPVIGATLESAEWELNRTLGQQVFKKGGVPVPPYREFSDYDQAIAYVKREDRRFVSKPCGDEPDKSLSYVAKSPEDLIYMLQRWKKAQKLKGKFILQEFVKGCEMAVGAWIGPKGFLEGWCENWEEKKLMAGDKGPATGEMGTVCRYVQRSKLAEKVLVPLEDRIVATGHTGYVDVNCILDEEGNAWPLEWTMRPGWPTFNIQQALHKGDPLEWLATTIKGEPLSRSPFSFGSLAVGVVLAIPDFPYSHATKKEIVGVPIYGLEKAPVESIHLCEAMLGTAPQKMGDRIVDAPMTVTAGDYVLVVTGTGETVRAARNQAYKVLDEIEVPASPFWRPDIGQRLKKQLPQIQSQGYATKMEF